MFFVTSNANKLAEAQSVFPELRQLKIELPEIQSLDTKEVVKAKLLEARKHSVEELVVEDTSVYLDCLNGLPGPLIKWFLDYIGTKGIFNIAEKLDNTVAEAVTMVGYAKGNDFLYFEGRIKGNLVSPRGTVGFGCDSIFQPVNATLTFSEMGKEEKNKISMRRLAFQQLKVFLEEKDYSVVPENSNLADYGSIIFKNSKQAQLLCDTIPYSLTPDDRGKILENLNEIKNQYARILETLDPI